jgi:hypothetical protein
MAAFFPSSYRLSFRLTIRIVVLACCSHFCLCLEVVVDFSGELFQCWDRKFLDYSCRFIWILRSFSFYKLLAIIGYVGLDSIIVIYTSKLMSLCLDKANRMMFQGFPSCVLDELKCILWWNWSSWLKIKHSGRSWLQDNKFHWLTPLRILLYSHATANAPHPELVPSFGVIYSPLALNICSIYRCCMDIFFTICHLLHNHDANAKL